MRSGIQGSAPGGARRRRAWGPSDRHVARGPGDSQGRCSFLSIAGSRGNSDW